MLDPWDDDLADLMALVRAIRAGSAVHVAFVLASANHGRMLIVAAQPA